MKTIFARPVRAAGMVALVGAAALAAAGSAFAHAIISPPVALAHKEQMFSLLVPTEKAGVTTTKVVLTVPKGFSIDSLVPAPGWTRQVEQTGTGEAAEIQRVTWTGGHVATGDDASFQFLADPASAGTYSFGVQQTYSDGSIVTWDGAETSDTPTPQIELKSSFGGGGTSTLLLVLLLAAGVGIGILVAVFVQLGRGGRPLV
jgi:uncharacterized protein YcnI